MSDNLFSTSRCIQLGSIILSMIARPDFLIHIFQSFHSFFFLFERGEACLRTTFKQRTPILNHSIHATLLLLDPEASCPSLNMANMYQYQPISDPRATRLIMLRKSPDENAPLSCAIVETTLDKPANYYALSYTWGSEGPSEAMEILPDRDSTTASTSVQDIVLTPNCAAALKLLRKRLGDSDTGVWVDAVCINQSNVAEKNVQVTMMAEIYRLAKCVIVWVGQQWAPDNTRSLIFLSNKWLGWTKRRAVLSTKQRSLPYWIRNLICGIASEGIVSEDLLSRWQIWHY